MEKDVYEYMLDPEAYVEQDLNQEINDIVLIVPDAYCNSSCSYCYFNKCNSAKPPVFLKDKILPLVLPFAEKTGRITFWAGEPLYNKELFIEICEFINQYLPKHYITIYTNGLLLDDWWADFFKEHKVNITLSHDGPGQKYRGVDYFKQDIQAKAIKKIYDNGNLLGVSSVIHKNNCSFYDIVNYFNDAERNLGVIFNKRVQSLVGANLSNDLPLNFNYMDPDLIKYVQDFIGFLLKELITGDKNKYVQRWYTWNSTKSYMPIMQCLFGIMPRQQVRCNKSDRKQVSINSLGQYMCVYQAYTGANLPIECKTGAKVDILESCKLCEIYDGCPIKGCQKLSIDKNFCIKTKERYKTIEFALTELLKFFGFDPKQK